MDDWKQSKDTQKQLHDFKQGTASAPPDMREAKEYNDHIMDKLDAGMKERGWKYTNEYTGSSYEGTKINNENEFDVMKVVKREDVHVKPANTPPYVKLEVPGANQASGKTHLSADEFKQNFRKDLHEIVNDDNELRKQVKVIDQDVGVRLDAYKPGGEFSHSTDVVGSIGAQGLLVTAKGEKDPEHWRKSHSVREKEMLKGSDKETLRILKGMREEDAPLKGLSTYAYKNAVLHQSQTPGWEHKSEAQKVTETMGYMKQCTDEKNLPVYFDEQENVLRGKTDIQLENVGNRLENLSVSEAKFKKVLQRSKEQE